MSISRQEERAVRDIGRRALEKAATAGSDKQAKGVSRMFATVTRVGGDGTLDVDSGSAAHPQQMLGLRMTSACYGVQVGNRVIVDTYAHVSVVTGILANSDSAPYVHQTIVSNEWGSVTVWSRGGVASLACNWTSPGSEWQDEVIATLPVGMRPPVILDLPFVRNNDSGYGNLSLSVRPDGSVRVTGHGGVGHQGDYITACGSWVVAT